MTFFTSVRAAIVAAVSAAALTLGAGAASAATVSVTIDFGTGFSQTFKNAYSEDGFEIAGNSILLLARPLGTSNDFPRSIVLDSFTTSLTLTRTGGGAFSLLSFDYTCLGVCNFSVGTTAVTRGPTNPMTFDTASPTGFANITSLVFTWNASSQMIDNIVLTYDDGLTPIPVPAALPLLLAGIGGLGLMARRKARAA